MVKYSTYEQRSPEWFQERAGKITGTTFGNIIDHKTGKLKKDTASRTPILTAVSKVIAEIQTGQPLDIGDGYQSFAMEWGEQMEQLIEDKYTTKAFKKVGFVTCDRYKYFGLSPDMLFFTGDDCTVAIEGKGPNSDTFIKYRITNKIPDSGAGNHMTQILSYFCNIPTLEKLKFVAVDPRNQVNSWFEILVTREELHPIIVECEKSMIEFEKLVDEYLNKLK